MNHGGHEGLTVWRIRTVWNSQRFFRGMDFFALVSLTTIICRVLYISGGCLGFLNHQQSVLMIKFTKKNSESPPVQQTHLPHPGKTTTILGLRHQGQVLVWCGTPDRKGNLSGANFYLIVV